ncbi:MAG: OsmC family protein [Candidatus Hodarchaeales archaeon]
MSIKTTGHGYIGRNEKGYLRVKKVEVEIEPILEGDGDRKKLERCVSIFKDYCIVSMSVKDGIPIETKVKLPVRD